MKTTQRALGTAGWIGSIAGLVLMPKCALCVSAYLLIGSSALWAGHEICGDTCGPFAAYIDRLHLPPWLTLGISVLSLAWIAWRGTHFALRFLRRRGPSEGQAGRGSP